MKMEIKKGYLKKASNAILNIGYCNAQYLLRYMQPSFYYCNKYGWRWDAYPIFVFNIGMVNIVDGYEGYYKAYSKNANFDRLKYFDTKACEVCIDNKLSDSEKEKKVMELLLDYLKIEFDIADMTIYEKYGDMNIPF